jgi:hypothetical protein
LRVTFKDTLKQCDTMRVDVAKIYNSSTPITVSSITANSGVFSGLNVYGLLGIYGQTLLYSGDDATQSFLVTTTTGDATVTTLLQNTVNSGSLYFIEVIVQYGTTDLAHCGSYALRASIYNDGTATLIGAVEQFTRERDAACDATIDVTGGDFRVRVTGLAGLSIRWVGFIRINSSTFSAA